MGLLDFPSPVSWYEGAKNSSLERKEIDAFVSSFYSSIITGLWSFGAKNWLGLGQVSRDIATALYLNLSIQETKNFLTITVPQALLEANNLAKFQSEYKTK